MKPEKPPCSRNELRGQAKEGMNAPRLAGIVILAFTGCASVPLPPEAASIVLVPASSAAIKVHRPRLLMRKGNLELEAYVFRQFEADTTADSHVDLVFLDGSGRTLRIETASFWPRSLSRAPRMPQPHAYVRTAVNIPKGTTTIEVRGHDGPHRDL